MAEPSTMVHIKVSSADESGNGTMIERLGDDSQVDLGDESSYIKIDSGRDSPILKELQQEDRERDLRNSIEALANLRISSIKPPSNKTKAMMLESIDQFDPENLDPNKLCFDDGVSI